MMDKGQAYCSRRTVFPRICMLPVRLGVMGVAGAVVVVALRLGQMRCDMTKSHMMANRTSE